jgi:hypothetical protein
LHVDRLENREQPGSILTTGLETSALADSLTRPHVTQDSLPALTRPEVNDSQVATPGQVPSTQQEVTYTTPKVVKGSTPTEFTQALDADQKPANTPRTVVNPAFHTQQAADSGKLVTAPNSSTPDSRPMTFAETKAANVQVTKQAMPVMGQRSLKTVSRQIDGENLVDTKFEGTPPLISSTQSDGTKIPDQLTYCDPGTAQAAEMLGSDAGRGGQQGDTYAVGFDQVAGSPTDMGRALLCVMDTGGAILEIFDVGSQAGFPLPAHPGDAPGTIYDYAARGIFSTAAGIYYVVQQRNRATGRVQSWCFCANVPLNNGQLTGVTGSRTVIQNGGVTVAEMTLYQENRAPTTAPIPTPIAQVGRIRYFAPGGGGELPGQDYTAIVCKDANLNIVHVVQVGFVDGAGNHLNSEGRTIRMNRQGAKYLGGRVQNDQNLIYENYVMKLSPDRTTILYALTYFFDSPPASDPQDEGGMYGSDLIGGATSTAGYYVTGRIHTTGFNPGVDSLLIAKLNLDDTGTTIWGWGWFVTGFDLAGEDAAVDRDGNMYTNGDVGDATDRDMELIKFDSTGGVILGDDFIGNAAAPGTQDRGYGIALQTGAPTANIMFAGWTETGPVEMNYPVTGPDTTYDGARDGLMGRYVQPL